MEIFLRNFLISISVGTLGRLYLLRVDYRQYPSYPRGIIMHLTFGVIAAALGAVAIPALLAQDYAAVTFLALAAEQFRNIRTMERENLANIEGLEMVRRGASYIEEIAKIFEARNYIVVLASLIASASLYLIPKWYLAVLTGFLTLVLLKYIMQSQKVSDIANVKIADIRFENTLLYVGNINIMNVGLEASRERILQTGIGVVLEPRDENASITLSNIGQRQAIVHDVVSQLGIKKDLDEPDFTPLARRDVNTGNIAIVFYPSIQDREALVKAVGYAPVLESTRRKPSESGAVNKNDQEGMK